jgi:tetratricopeptide (TPR) repeat protein
VRFHDPVPPRGLQPKVPRDLETICLKSLSKASERRYPTAEALAEDLRRWLNGEPILARPVKKMERGWRWCQRNPLVAGLTAVVSLLLVAGTVTTTSLAVLAARKAADTEEALKREEALAGQLRNALDETKQAYGKLSGEQERTKKALAESLKRRKQYRAALDVQTSLYLENLLSHQKVLTEEHKQFLRQALKSYEELATDVGQDEETRTGVAYAQGRVGGIRLRLGMYKEAEPAFGRAIALFKQLATDFAKEPTHRRFLGISHNDLGNVLSATARLDQAEGEYRAALTVQEPLADDFRKVPEYRHDLIATRSNLAVLLVNTGRLQEAEAEFGATLTLQRRLADDFPKVPEYRQELATAHYNLGVFLKDIGRLKEAETAFRDALAIRKQQAKEFLNVPAHRRGLALSHLGLGAVFEATGRRNEAETEYRAALDLGKRLAADFPTVPDYLSHLAYIHNALGVVFVGTGRPKEAETEYRAAIAIRKQLAKEFPNVPDYQIGLAETMLNLAIGHHACKEFQAARLLLEEALPHHRAALEANPRHPEYGRYYCLNRLLQTATLLALGDHGAASATAEQLGQAAVDRIGDTYKAACYLARCVPLAEKDDKLSELQRKERVQQYGDRALKLLQLAVKHGFNDVQRLKKDPALAPLRSRADFQELVAELEKKSRPD